MHITLKTDWESPLPERYLTPLVPLAPVGIPSSGSSLMSALTGTNRLTGSASLASAPASRAFSEHS
jgi:hypothetical protein